MNAQQALSEVKAMKVKSNSVVVNSNYVVTHPSKTSWRLGEVCGDWITSGTAEEVIGIAYRNGDYNRSREEREGFRKLFD